MSAASAPGVKRLSLVGSRFRYWLAVALALVAVASILRRADHRWFPSYRHSSRARPLGQVGGGTFAIVRQHGAVGIASTSRAAARASGRSPYRYLRGAVYWLAVAVASVALLAVIASVGARLFGYSPYVMYGGSMGSTAPMGSVAFIEDVPAGSLQVGDVIVFRPPSQGEARQPVMHRIISIEEVDGQRVIRTKGDANESADPWQLRLTGEGGRLVHVVPYVGYLLWFFQTRTGWAFVALPLAAYLGFVALRWIWAAGGTRGNERVHVP